MRIKGKDFSSLSKPRTMVIPVEGGDDVVLKYSPILSFKEYDQKYPEPQPPSVTTPGGKTTLAYDDEDFIKRVDEWTRCKTEWMIWKSLSCNEGIEWEKVDETKPETFFNVREELQESFGDGAVVVLVTKIIDASNLRADMIDIATKDFLATGAVGGDH